MPGCGCAQEGAKVDLLGQPENGLVLCRAGQQLAGFVAVTTIVPSVRPLLPRFGASFLG